MNDKPPIEVRVYQESDGTWTVDGVRGEEFLYRRAWNRTADEAWQYGAEWMRGELGKI